MKVKAQHLDSTSPQVGARSQAGGLNLARQKRRTYLAPTKKKSRRKLSTLQKREKESVMKKKTQQRKMTNLILHVEKKAIWEEEVVLISGLEEEEVVVLTLEGAEAASSLDSVMHQLIRKKVISLKRTKKIQVSGPRKLCLRALSQISQRVSLLAQSLLHLQ